jgi:calcineurin-like phosphoesterase family protein
MNQVLTDNWNSTVGPEDTVYHLGDFSMGGKPHSYAKRLNGKKILILGNHDRESQLSACGFFHKIRNYEKIEIDGKIVHLKHYPFKPNVSEYDVKFIDRMLEDDGNWLIHGHVHNSKPVLTGKSINVSCEWHNYTPVSEEDIIKIMRSV